MKNFFISYNRHDRTQAEWIAWQLEAAGYSVVVQAWDFQEGQNFVHSMQQAITEATRTLVVLSPEFLASQFTAPEWMAAFAKDPTGKLGLLLPVRVKPCEPTGLLAQIVYIDLLGAADKDEARRRLLAGVDKARRKPATEPDLPPLTADPSYRPSTPEPPWVYTVDTVAEKASGALWHVARVLALAIAIAVGIDRFLASQFPTAQDESSATLAFIAATVGAIMALGLTGVRRWWRRRTQKRHTRLASPVHPS